MTLEQRQEISESKKRQIASLPVEQQEACNKKLKSDLDAYHMRLGPEGRSEVFGAYMRNLDAEGRKKRGEKTKKWFEMCKKGLSSLEELMAKEELGGDLSH
ncbi:MAG: hypothetical protein SGCHY_002711 [Lobulomycetales sp.]